MSYSGLYTKTVSDGDCFIAETRDPAHVVNGKHVLVLIGQAVENAKAIAHSAYNR